MNRIAKLCTRNIVCVLFCLATFPVRRFFFSPHTIHIYAFFGKNIGKKEHRIGLKEC